MILPLAKGMEILFLCQRSELNRERRGYFAALSKCGGVVLNDIQHRTTFDTSGATTCGTPLASCSFVLFPDPPSSILPTWLARSPAPTVCFQIDTYTKPGWRALWSSLFDYVIVFHPGYERYFSRYGHQKVLLFPHAVDASDFANDAEVRIYDIGWVGRVDGPLYEARRRALPILSARYKLNDWQRIYAENETPKIYSSSRIVVNIGRDDYPQDANLRCFEAMAAGALLITRLPSELEQFGFRAAKQFVGYHHEQELPALLDFYLRETSLRNEIARAARELVLREHTYDARVAALLSILKTDAGRLMAPARQWPKHRVDYVYLHYFCKRVMLEEATAEFRKLVGKSPLYAVRGIPWLMRCWQHKKAADANHT